jgi:hypothetical protein
VTGYIESEPGPMFAACAPGPLVMPRSGPVVLEPGRAPGDRAGWRTGRVPVTWT